MGIQINNSNFCNMLKATEYKLEDSNVEGLGGDEDRALKKNAAKGEPAWEGVEALPPGEMKIWRIEKFKVIAWPKEEYGSFYDGGKMQIKKKENRTSILSLIQTFSFFILFQIHTLFFMPMCHVMKLLLEKIVNAFFFFLFLIFI